MYGKYVTILAWLLSVAVLASLFGAATAYLGGRRSPPAAEPPRADEGQEDPPALFRDVTAASGLHFTSRNGEEAGHYAILESLGGGVALFDYDGDGLLDVFLPGGGFYGGPDRKQIQGHPSKLYRNLGGWKFQDVTATAGLDEAPSFYTHGCAVADYDRDGWPDLLVTGWGRLALFHNEPNRQGGRRFTDVTRQAGLADDLWGTSAAWGDLDGDGYPDLYVCHYVNWSFANHPTCDGGGPSADRDICPPKRFTALPHALYRNNGDGTFTAVSRPAGLRRWTDNDGKGLGVLLVDVNGDGRPDVYVANDTVDNFLYLNRSSPGKVRLEEVGLVSGVARYDQGRPNGSMGVDAADYDGRGRPALWVTNYEGELPALYRHEGLDPRDTPQFTFASYVTGVAAVGKLFVGFGTGFLDIDNKGWEDLVITNGHVIRHPTAAGLEQRPLLLRNEGEGWYKDVSRQGGPYFRERHIGRGLAVGDLDNDGWPDLVISHLNSSAVLLRNEARAALGQGHHWLGIELVGANNRDVVGARLVLEAGGRRQTRFAKGGGSYLSSGDRRHLFGLGNATRIDRLTVVWPSGRQQHWDGSQLPADGYRRLVEGKRAPALPRGR
jgi:hypothetical protein